ncbi:hypothetical protein BH09ACT12_BH09ACT12_05270 [soil metagenome]
MASSGEYGQGQGTLTKAAGLVTEAKADFNSLSAKLSNQISSVESKWGGQGATAFFTLHRTWTEKQRIIVKALDDFADSLTLTERDNVSNDEQQASNMSNLMNKLG